MSWVWVFLKNHLQNRKKDSTSYFVKDWHLTKEITFEFFFSSFFFFLQAFGKFLRGCKRPTFGLQNRFRRTSRWMVKRSHTKCKSKFTLFIFQDFFFQKQKQRKNKKTYFHVNLSLGFGSSGLCIFAWSRGSLTMSFTFIISKEFW